MLDHLITTVHTLGPSGTNCELAAFEWSRRRGGGMAVELHCTLEEGVEATLSTAHSALLGCIVYPKLHELVFRNLHRLRLSECFIMPTYSMVLASRDRKTPSSVVSHPAPVPLLEQAGIGHLVPRLVTSNAVAARVCASGEADACITTRPAADAYGLCILTDFGPVDMGFSVHVPFTPSLRA